MEKKFIFFKKVSISFLLCVLCAICLFFAFSLKPQSVLADSDPLAEANVHLISELNSNDGQMQDGEWWIVDKNFLFYRDEGLIVSGNVNLILNDNVTLDLYYLKFDMTTESTLSIHAQSKSPDKAGTVLLDENADCVSSTDGTKFKTFNIYGGNVIITTSRCFVGNTEINVYDGNVNFSADSSDCIRKGDAIVNVYGGTVNMSSESGNCFGGNAEINVYGGSINISSNGVVSGNQSCFKGEAKINVYDGELSLFSKGSLLQGGGSISIGEDCHIFDKELKVLLDAEVLNDRLNLKGDYVIGNFDTENYVDWLCGDETLSYVSFDDGIKQIKTLNSETKNGYILSDSSSVSEDVEKIISNAPIFIGKIWIVIDTDCTLSGTKHINGDINFIVTEKGSLDISQLKLSYANESSKLSVYYSEDNENSDSPFNFKSYKEKYIYVDENGNKEEKWIYNYRLYPDDPTDTRIKDQVHYFSELSGNSSEELVWDTWWIVDKDYTFNNTTLRVGGYNNIILKDGCTLTVKGLSSSSQYYADKYLNVYAESTEQENAGSLVVENGFRLYGIESNGFNVYGGNVEIRSGNDGYCLMNTNLYDTYASVYGGTLRLKCSNASDEACFKTKIKLGKKIKAYNLTLNIEILNVDNTEIFSTSDEFVFGFTETEIPKSTLPDGMTVNYTEFDESGNKEIKELTSSTENVYILANSATAFNTIVKYLSSDLIYSGTIWFVVDTNVNFTCDITVLCDVRIILTEDGLIKYNGFKINKQDDGNFTVYYTEMDERIEDVDDYPMIDNGAYVFEINDDNKEDVFAKYLPLGISNLPLWFIFTDDVEIEDGLYIYGDVNFVFEDGIEVYFNNVNYIGDASLSIYGISTDFYDTARIYFNSVSQGDCELSVYGGIVSVTSSGSYLLGKRLSVYGGLFIAENTGNGNIFSSFPTGSTLNFGEDVGVYVPFNRFAPKDKNAFIKNQINSGKLIFTTEDGISFYIEDSGIENWFTSYDIDGNRYTTWLEDGDNVYYDIDYEVPFGTEWETCWLVVEDELYFSDCVRFARFATINVLLKDWSSLYFDYGIYGDMGFTLNIFAQSSDPDDMGYMDVYSDVCAIDCSFNDFYVNVYGGNVTIESDSSALALRRYTENYLSIYGGIVTLSSYGDVGTLGSNGLFGVGYHLFIKEGLPVFMEDENRFVESGEFNSIGYHPGTLIIGDYDVKKNPRKPENTDFLIPYITFDEDGNPKTEYVNKYAQDVFYLSNDSKCSVFSEYTESGYFQDLSAIWVIVEGNCSYPSYINLDYEVNVILRENSSLSFNKLYLRPQFGVGVLKVYSETLDYGKMGTLTMGNVLEHYYTNDEERIEVYGGIVKIGQTYSDSFYSTVQEPIYVYGGLVEISDIYNSNIYNIEKRASLLSGNANLILGKDINVYKDESFIKTTVENRKENGWKDNRITLCSESAIEWYKSTVPGILYVYYDDNNAPQKAWLMSTNGWLIVEGDMEITERYTGAKNILLKNMSSIVFLNGIHVGQNETLRIYAQTENTKFAGKMEVYGFDGNAAVGGNYGQNGESSGNVYIFGGNVLIKNDNGVAIGGGNSVLNGQSGAGGSVYIVGGNIDLIGGEGYAVVGAGGLQGSNGDVSNGTVHVSKTLSALHVQEHTEITENNIAEFLKSGEILIDNGQTVSQSIINETLIENAKDFNKYLLEHPDEIIHYIELKFDVQTETPIKFADKLTIEMNGFTWVFAGEPNTTAFTSTSDKKATFIINGVSAEEKGEKKASFIVYKECLSSFLTAKNCDVIISDLYVENLYTETDGAFLNLLSYYANVTLENVTVYDSHAKMAGGAICIVGDGNYWNIKSVTNTIKLTDTVFENCFSDTIGGGMYLCWMNPVITGDNAIFKNCHSLSGGGGLFITDQNRNGEHRLSNCRTDGMCYMSGVTFINCFTGTGIDHTANYESIVKNSQNSQRGGGLCLQSRVFNVKDCGFQNCMAGYFGGGIYCSYDIDKTKSYNVISHCNFVNCKSTYGGYDIVITNAYNHWLYGSGYGKLENITIQHSDKSVMEVSYIDQTDLDSPAAIRCYKDTVLEEINYSSALVGSAVADAKTWLFILTGVILVGGVVAFIVIGKKKKIPNKKSGKKE